MTGAELLAQLEPLHTQAFGWARHCCGGDLHAAEDALQSAYTRVALERARFSGESALKTWWLGVVRLVALEQRRRAYWRLEKLRTWFASGERWTPESDHTDAAAPQPLANAIAHLPVRQREVLHLVFYQELSLTGAASAMGVSAGSARQHYDRAKRRLRLLLADKIHTDERT